MSGRRQVQADVDQLDPAAITQRMNGFEAAEGHGQRGVHVRPFGGAGLHVDAAGDVDGHHRSGSTPANTSAAFGRNGPDPEMPTTPSITRSVAAGMLCTTRTASAGECGQVPPCGCGRD